MNAVRSWALALLVAASAAPAHAARDVVLVLDNSGSMKRNDPARLAAPAVAEFIRSQPRDTRVAIVLFTAQPALAMPLTPTEVAADGVAAQALAQFNYRGAWTQTAAAVERALYELRNEGRPDAQRVIVLMTDGLIDTGDPQHDAELNKWLRVELALQAAREKIAIFGIAFTERADYQLLQSLAATTDGEYFRVLSADGIARALQRIESVLAAAEAPAAAAAPPATSLPSAPPAESAPALTDTGDADAAEPDTAVAPAVRWLGWSALLLGLFATAVGLWWRFRHQRVAEAATPTAPVKRDRGPQAVLFDSMQRYELGARPVVIGRAGGQDPDRDYIIVPDKTVGRWHATIERRGQTFWIRDEGSVNGTFLNGERIVGERPLKHHDQVRFHNHAFEFEIPELGDFDRTVMQPSPRPMN